MATAGGKRKRSEVEASSGDAAANTVYLEGIPFTATVDDIHTFFDGCGEIVEVRAPKFQDSGRLMGYAHVKFATAAGYKAALGRDRKHIGTRFVTVAAAKPAGAGADAALAFSSRSRPAGCATLFVKNLPYECDEEALKAAFTRFGAVASVRLARWNHTDRLKGFGYVTFEHGFSAEAAMKAYRSGAKATTTAAAAGGAGAASGAAAGEGAEGAEGGGPLTISGRVIHMDYETGAPRAGFKTSQGRAFSKTEEAAGVKLQAHRVALRAKERAKAGAGAAAAAAAEEEGGGEADSDAGAAPRRGKSATRRTRGDSDAADDDHAAGKAASGERRGKSRSRPAKHDDDGSDAAPAAKRARRDRKPAAASDSDDE